MKDQLPLNKNKIIAHHQTTMHKQTVEHQIHDLLTSAHHLLEQLHEPFRVEHARIGTEPETPTNDHNQNHTNQLPLPQTLHNRGLAAHAPNLTIHCVGAKTGFIPEE